MKPGRPDPPQARVEPRPAIVLVLLTLLAYGQVGGFGYVNFDDPLAVSRNPQVLAGLSADTLRWAFSTFHLGNWIPLTWISLAADISLFGPDPGAQHLVNLTLHAAAAVFLYAFLCASTGRPGRSMAVAALFALHPLHVESVAWISERKDVLSTLFWFAALVQYQRWTRRPGPGGRLATLGLFLLGLLCKPMLVTFPATLLLVDVWPLGRLRSFDPRDPATRRLLLEKVPFLLLSLPFVGLALVAQGHSGAVVSLQGIPAVVRLGQAALAAVTYLGQMLWPVRLAVFYPYPATRPPAWAVAAAAAVLLAITAAVLQRRHRQPYLLAGWAWYLVTLLPVIGLVQIGSQAHADRYTYVPLVGVFTALCWALADLAERGRLPRALTAGAAATVVLVLAAATHLQARHWRDSEALFRRAAAAVEGNAWAHENLGHVLLQQGRLQAAAQELRTALALAPDSWRGHLLLIDALTRLGLHEEALYGIERARRLRPEAALLDYYRAGLLVACGRRAEAVPALQRVLQSRPGQVHADPRLAQEALFESRMLLGRTLLDLGRPGEAVAPFAAALVQRPGSEPARQGLAEARRRAD